MQGPDISTPSPTPTPSPSPVIRGGDDDSPVLGIDSEAKERIREQQLIGYVKQFLTSRDLRQCHPSIRIKSPFQGYIPRVRPQMYQGIRKVLDDSAQKTSFFRLRYDEKKFRLYVIVPGPTHALLKEYAEHIKTEMRSEKDKNKSFYPHEFHGSANDDLIQETSSAELPLAVNGILKARQPDGALSIKGCKYPFLTIELSPSSSEKEIFKVADDYIYGSNGMIRFVMVVSVTSSSPTVSPTDSATAEVSDGRLKPSSVIHVSVFESIFVPRTQQEGGTSTVYKVRRRPLIEKVPIYPDLTNEFFEISWSDIVDDPPDPCPVPFVVSFADLYSCILKGIQRGSEP